MPDACLVFACAMEYLPLLHVQSHLLSSSSLWGLLAVSAVKESACNSGNAGVVGSIPSSLGLLANVSWAPVFCALFLLLWAHIHFVDTISFSSRSYHAKAWLLPFAGCSSSALTLLNHSSALPMCTPHVSNGTDCSSRENLDSIYSFSTPQCLVWYIKKVGAP